MNTRKAVDPVEIDTSLVRRLVAAQFPRWANLVVSPVDIQGNDNRTFRLGDSMSVRLPSAGRYAAGVEKEQTWLPRLAGQLPLQIPAPLALGMPTEEYPWHWSVYRWLDGEVAQTARIADPGEFATSLAGFLAALQRIDTAGGPPAGAHCFHRGGSLAIFNAQSREAIAALGDGIEGSAATEVWEAALAATWRGPPVWFHGDVSVGNLLVKEGQLSAVVDFGTSGVGDPACDLTIAWTLFEGTSRETLPISSSGR
jgi:aminoglycoside phosphotransferase (APT) family kinase protein